LGAAPMRLKCPVCYVGTTSLKRYGVIHYVLFLGIAVRWQHGSFTACPGCVRKRVLKDTFSPLHILSANLMWLLAVLPYNLGLMIASTIPGHSRSVVERIEENLGGDAQGKRKEMPPLDAATLRQTAIEKVQALKKENAPRSGDSYYRSHTGYDYGRSGDRGFGIALSLLRTTEPEAGETGPAYLERAKALIRAQRDETRAGEADEDGACSGALDAAAWAVAGVVPGAPEEGPKRPWVVPPEEIEWELLHVDLFDRECPPNVETGGHGLVGGLTELWRRYLSASIGAGGERGLSRFHLSWEGGSAMVRGDRSGAARLRGWVGDDPGLLGKTAHAHAELLLADWTSEKILAAAAAAADHGEFEARLSGLAR